MSFRSIIDFDFISPSLLLLLLLLLFDGLFVLFCAGDIDEVDEVEFDDSDAITCGC